MSVKPTKFPENDYLYPPVAESSRLLLGCRREDYSASRIAHAVEDCNAHLLNLNVTSGSRNDFVNESDDESVGDGKFPVVVDIRVSHLNAQSITRSLERYGYTVIGSSSEIPDNDTLRERIDGLFRYLEM